MDDSKWDPMKEHFSNDNFYDTGPGAKIPKDYQPGNTRQHGRQNLLKLYVAHLPTDFDEDAMRNIFSKYGTIKDMFISPNRQFAGITYAEQNSAHQALIALSSDRIYNLKVSYWMDKDKSAQDNMQKKSQQYRLSGFVNNHPKLHLVGLNNENDSFSGRLQSNSFAEDHMNSTAIASRRSSICQQEKVPLNPLPSCAHCGKRTLEQCVNCRVYYCSKKCMVHGFEHHAQDNCITIAPHTLDPDRRDNQNEKNSSSVVNTAGQQKNVSRLNQFQSNKAMCEFEQSAQDYRNNYVSTNSPKNHESFSISNSYDDDDGVKQNSHRNGHFVAKNATDDVNAGIRHMSGHQRDKQNYRQREDESLTNRSTALNSENQVPKTTSRIRNENNGYHHRNDNSGTKTDGHCNTQNARRYDNSRNDGNRSEEFTRNRNNSKYENTNRLSYQPKQKYEDQAGKSDVKNESSLLNDDEDRIAFSDAPPPPTFGEKKKSTDGLHEKPDNRNRSNNYTSNEKRDNKQQSDGESRVPEYITSRKSYKEGDKLEVRLTEIISDSPEYSSIKIVEEEGLLSMLLADMMKETSLPPVSLKANTKCIVCRDHERVRAIIVSGEPLRVKYIDTGYKVHECEEEEVKGCPDRYLTTRPFACKVKFLNAVDLDLNLKRLKEENKTFNIIIKKKTKEFVWDVDIIAPDFNERLEKARQVRDNKNGQKDSKPKLSLQAEVPVKVLITYIEENKRIFYIARFDDLENIVNKIQKQHETVQKLEKIVKNKFCLTFVEDDDAWYRAEIIETDPLKVHFIDYGNAAVVNANHLKEMPAPCQGEPLAIKVKLADGETTDYGIEEYVSHYLRPVTLNEERIWTVVSEECLFVVVTHIVSKDECYVVQKKDQKLMEEVAELPFIPLKSPPKVGSTYLHIFDDMNCRAQLVKGSPPTVRYVDYGNEGEIGDDQLGELSGEWQKRDPLAFKIFILPEFTKTPVTEYETFYIKEKGDNKWMITKRV